MNTCAKILNNELHSIFREHDNVVTLGEDILDPYGGAFKITKGLSTNYPKRVFTTPISEAAITGIATGLALNGMIPIVEIMFGDFLSLTFDQILNHLTKFKGMYDSKVDPHVVVRAPMGGYRGYGPTHSQSLEKYFMGIPNLKVVAMSHLGPLAELFRKSIVDAKEPLLFIENKTLYSKENLEAKNNKIENYFTEVKWNKNNTYSVTMKIRDDMKPDYTIVTYGGTVPIVMEAVEEVFMEYEILGEIVVITSLSPLDMTAVLESAKETKALITVEEGTEGFNIGSEIIARTVKQDLNLLKTQPVNVSAGNGIVPNSKVLENDFLPSKEVIVNNIKKMMKVLSDGNFITS